MQPHGDFRELILKEVEWGARRKGGSVEIVTSSSISQRRQREPQCKIIGSLKKYSISYIKMIFF